MRVGVEHLTQVIHEAKITNLEMVTKAQLWRLFQIRYHTSNKRAQGGVEDNVQSQSDTETKKLGKMKMKSDKQQEDRDVYCGLVKQCNE